MKLALLFTIFIALPICLLAGALYDIFSGRAHNRGYAYTVLPLLVLAVLLFTLGGFVYFSMLDANRHALRSSCLSDARFITLAMVQYAGDYNDQYPSALVDDSEPAQRRLARLMKSGYVDFPKIFHCPATAKTPFPDRTRLDGPTFVDSSLKSLADVFLDTDWCSYGVDIRVTHKDPASRAVAADRPDRRYWGTGVNSPPAGHPGSNSENHKGKGQNVAYNDGHVKWSPTCADDSALDPNIYATNPEMRPADDSNIDFGAAPPP